MAAALLLVGTAFVLSALTLHFVAAGAWLIAAGCGILSLGTLHFALRLRLGESASSDPHLEGLALLVGAIVVSVAAAGYLLVQPYVDWVLLAYPLAAVLGWAGEVRLRGEALRGRLVKLRCAAVTRSGELIALAIVVLAGLAMRIWML